MTTQDQAAADAAKAIAAWLGTLHDESVKAARAFAAELATEYRALADALTALDPPLPPEPELGSIVLDGEGDAWIRHETGWVLSGDTESGRSWAALHERYAPLTPLLPASSVVDVALAREAAEALRDLLGAVANKTEPLPSTFYAARTALARLDAATGGAR